MTLDDFFTLTEMNNGLAVPSRVKELVAVIKKDMDCIVKNVGEATRQWSAVASAIAATENQDCLDLFIHLDGLQFIGKWLNDARRFSNDSSDSFLEESITHLLQALEKLHVGYEKVVDTEIWTTVEGLLGHTSSKIQDKAQALFENWKKKRDKTASLSDVENVGALTDDDVRKSVDAGRSSGHSEVSQADDSPSRETTCKEKGQESIRDDLVLSTGSDVVHTNLVENTHHSNKILNPAVGDDRPLDLASSPSLPKSAMELPLCHSVVATSTESCNPGVAREDTLDESHELESASDVKHTSKFGSSSEKLGSLEEFNTLEERTFPSSSDAADAIKSITEPSSQKVSLAGDRSVCNEGSSSIDSWKFNSDRKGSIAGRSSGDQRRSSSAFTAEGSEHHTLYKSSSSEKNWDNTELGAALSGTEDHRKSKKLDLHVAGDNLANDYKFNKKERRREPDRAVNKSDVDLYGIIDPLEVARQVAMEVEREVVDYREQSCSSSEELPECNVRQPDSSDSLSGKQSHASEASPTQVADDPDFCAEASAMQEESATSTENLDPEQTNGTQDMATSKVTEATQEEIDVEKGPCTFDLNQEICFEDADHSGNQFPRPVSIVSASRAAAVPGLPIAPLQFEGNLGWKGSAATSAFRPASPRRVPESEKDLSAGESSSSSKQRQRFLDFDLNVTESADGRTGDQSPGKYVAPPSNLLFGESSSEINPRRSERLELDLNCTSEDGERPLDWRMGHFFPQGNGHHSGLHSSTSSSKQPSLKNIDLNDQPSFLNDSCQNSSGGIKPADSVISIMGTRVEVNRKDFVSPTLPLPNGRTSELAFDINMGRPGGFLGIGSVLPYAPSPVYGYSNIAAGVAMPFSSTMYGSGGPIPYMMDSRGAPVIPQIIGSASALPTSFSQAPVFINMNSPNPSNGAAAVGPSQNSFDLNSGEMVEGGSRDPAGFTQFLNSSRVRSMDEQLRSNPQPSVNSVISGKRKEPDNGWEHYPFKHYTPPWK